MEQELKKAALSPRNTFTSKYHDMHFLHDFVTQNTTEFWLLLVRACSVDFEHALQKKVRKMRCSYPRKHFRAKKQAQNCNLKTSLKKQPERAIS